MDTQVLKVSLGKAVIDVADAKEALLKAQANRNGLMTCTTIAETGALLKIVGTMK